MRWIGKIIGFSLGLVFFPPLGPLIGLFIGHLFDIGLFNALLPPQAQRTAGRNTAPIQQAFFETTFILMGFLAKSDGRVTVQEIRAAEHIMTSMGLDADKRREAIYWFNQGKSPGIHIDQVIDTLRRHCWLRPSLLRTFLEIQFTIAYAEGNISPTKRDALQYICQKLGIPNFNFNLFEQQFRAQQHYQQYGSGPHHGQSDSYSHAGQQNGQQQSDYRSQQRAYSQRELLQDAYKILGVTAEADHPTVKRAYRKLMSQHHPDRLIAKGVPPEMIKLATQKTQQIKAAYETIKQAKGW